MKIHIIQIGKTKDKNIAELVSEYIKRTSPYAKVEFRTLNEEKLTSSKTKEKIIQIEGEKILKNISSDFIVALDETGKQFGSIDFAGIIKKQKDVGQKITFIIGGAFGLSNDVKAKANLTLSLSKMTFTHEMVRLFLMEQVYRAFSIIAGKGYHNE